ncbi:hypothetical protein GUJ93_ZPchr0005g15688 [Zizania palustris]|uniref:Uncharacterized protein n=1 Tax=Zizania palustris TaxID=103762 RepID=A0A8J5VRL5_ZIZPA|nr:hypothetical protein GUJ93_ZPchr0005g15688 [Zizania palustris]
MPEGEKLTREVLAGVPKVMESEEAEGAQAAMVEGAEEAQVIEPEDLGQVLALEIQTTEPRDPGQVDAEGVQVAKPEVSESEHRKRDRATKPKASVPTGAEVVVVEETGPQVAHSPLKASVDSGEDFLRMFEQMDSLNQSSIAIDRGPFYSIFSFVEGS